MCQVLRNEKRKTEQEVRALTNKKGEATSSSQLQNDHFRYMSAKFKGLATERNAGEVLIRRQLYTKEHQ